MQSKCYCCYVNSKYSGLVNRVINLSKSSINFKFIVFTNEIPNFVESNISWYKVPKLINFFQIILLPFYINIKLRKYNFNFIILRSLFPSLFYYLAFRKINYKLVTEHHSYILSEYKALNKKYLRLMAGLFYKKCLELSDGFIFISNEIGNQILKNVNKPHIVVGNGIYYNKSYHVGFKKFYNNSIDILFIASVYAPWHGIERLIESIKYWPSEYEIKLHIVGDICSDDLKINVIDHGVIFHGFLTNKEISKLVCKCNIASSTLNCNVISKEASSLKTREYILYNIPFIYSYHDTDINKKQEFCHKIPLDDSLIPFESILKLIIHTSSNYDNIISIMKSYSRKISYEKKLNKLNAFLSSQYD